MWHLRMFKLSIAAEFIEKIVDEHDGSAKIDEILTEMLEVPKYQKMENKLHSFVIAATKESKNLRLVKYYRKSGDKDVIVCRGVAPHVAPHKDVEVRDGER